MKKIFVVLLSFFSLSVFGQSSFCKGWERGYQKGLESCNKVGVTPICPIPNVGNDSYNHGYGRGYSQAKSLCGNNDSKEDVDYYRIGKESSPKFTDVSKAVDKGVNNAMSALYNSGYGNVKITKFSERNGNRAIAFGGGYSYGGFVSMEFFLNKVGIGFRGIFDQDTASDLQGTISVKISDKGYVKGGIGARYTDPTDFSSPYIDETSYSLGILYFFKGKKSAFIPEVFYNFGTQQPGLGISIGI